MNHTQVYPWMRREKNRFTLTVITIGVLGAAVGVLLARGVWVLVVTGWAGTA